MSEFPMMIYKGGKLSVFKRDQRMVKDAREALLAIEEGFWTHDAETAEDAKSLPYMRAFMKVEVAKAEEEKLVEEIIEESIEPEPEEAEEEEEEIVEPTETEEPQEVEEEPEEVEEVQEEPPSEEDLISVFEMETGKNAFWRGKETKGFKTWKEEHNA